MTPKSKNILVGMFVIFFSVGAVAFITWLGTTTVREETDTYIAYLDESVSGLSQNSPVKYKGVNIGQVQKIQINPNNSNQVELQLIIKRGTPIKKDSQLILTSQGITGLQYIEITGGSEEEGFLETKPGEEFPVIPSGKSTLATVEAAIGPMLGNINLAIEDIRQVLKSANPERLTSILTDVESITGSIAGNSDAIIQDFNQTSAGLKQVVEQTSHLMENANNFFNNREDQVVALISKIDHASSAVNRLLDTIEQEKIVGNLGQTLTHVDQLVENLNGRGEGPLLNLVNGISQSTNRLNLLLEQFEQEQIAQGVGKTITNVDQLIANIHGKVDGPVDTILNEIQQSAQAANRLVTQIEQEHIVKGIGKTMTDVDQLIVDFNGKVNGPIDTVLNEIQQSAQATNRLVTRIEQEQIVEGVGQTITKVGHIIENLEHTATEADQFVSSLNQTAGNVGRLMDNLDRTTGNVDQFVSSLNQTMTKTDQFISNLDHTVGNVDQFVGNLNQTATNVNQFIANLNKTASTIENFVASLDQTTASVEDFMGNLNQTAIKADQFVSNLNHTTGNVDQFVSNLNQTATNVDHFVGSLDQTVTKADQFVANLNQATGNVNQFMNILNQTANQTDQFVASLNQTATKIDRLVDNLNTQISKKELQSVPQSINTTLQEIQKLTTTLNQTAEEADFAGTIEDLKEVLVDIQIFVQTWTQLAKELEKQPSALIFGESKEEINVAPQ